MGFDIHITASPWLAQPGSALAQRFTLLLRKWDNVGLSYVNWSNEVLNVKCYQVSDLSSTSTSTQVNFYNSGVDLSSTTVSMPGSVSTATLTLFSCKDLAPATGYFCFFQFTNAGLTTGNTHGIAVDSSFSMGWAVPAYLYAGRFDDSLQATATVATSHGLSLTGMSNVTFDDPQVTITSSGASIDNGGTVTLTNGAYTISPIITVWASTCTFTATWVGTEEASAARPSTAVSTAIPVIGYAVSSSDTGHRLPLDTGRFVVSTIANGQAPSTVVACPSVTLKALLNDRNSTAIATEGFSFSFPLNEAGAVTYGFLRSAKVKWVITTFTFGGNRFKIDSSADGTVWTNRASVIVPSASGTMTVDIGSMIGAHYFRCYFDDGGTAATITFTYIIPIGIQPGSPIDIVDAGTGLPLTSEEIMSVPSPAQSFEGAVSTYRDIQLKNRHPTQDYRVELAHAPSVDSLTNFTKLTFTNTSDAPIEKHIVVNHASNSSTIRLRYTLSAGANLQDGIHAGRVLARLVRADSADVRVYHYDSGTQQIWAYNLGGVRQEQHNVGVAASAVCVDPYAQEIYLLRSSTGSPLTVDVWDIVPAGSPKRTLTISNGSIPADTWSTIAVLHGYLFIGGSSTSGQIVIADAKGPTSQAYVDKWSLSSAITGGKFMTTSPDGYLFVSTGTADHKVDQFDVWSGSLIRTLNHGAASGSHTLDCNGLTYDHLREEVVIATGNGSDIEFFRYTAATGANTIRGYTAASGNKPGNGLVVGSSIYFARNVSQWLKWSDGVNFTGASVITLSPNIVGSEPFQHGWLY